MSRAEGSTRGGGRETAARPAAERFLREAIELARRGEESVSPNPMVGAVLARGGRVVGRGYHHRFGGPHAEIEALRDAGDARGCDLYVSLEPCGHHGKTPPCADALIEAGVRRVRYAVADPNPRTRGRGPRKLRRAGIEVLRGPLAAEAARLNRPYFHWRRSGRPWVILKWAMTLDGKIATAAGESQWITGRRAREAAHRLRRRVDAVLVGTGTAVADDPLLTPRPARGRHPLRVFLDRRGRVPLALKLLAPLFSKKRSGFGKRLCVVSHLVPKERRGELERRGIEVLRVASSRGRLDLESLLASLGDRGVSQVLVEGGGKLAGSLVEIGAVDEVAVFVAPRIVGGAAAPSPVGGRGIETLADALDLTETRIEPVGKDVLLRGIVRRK